MKKCLILVSILLLTGCSVNYNLKIDEHGFNETINGTVLEREIEKDPRGDTLFYSLLTGDQLSLIDGSDKYEKKITKNGDNTDFEYNYTYKNNFEKSRIMNQCYEKVNFKETDDYYFINLDGRFNCMVSDNINVKITTDYIVSSSNANEVKGNSYIWNLTKDNTKIEMLILKVKDTTTNSKPQTNYIRIIGGGIFAILVIIALIIWKRKNNAK